jgi:hypothetical protein
MDVLGELRKYGTRIPAKAPPQPVCFSDLGIVGHVENRRGLYINSGIERYVNALVRENARAERLAKELTGGRFNAQQLLDCYALGSDSRDAIRAIKRMAASITNWDGVVNARANNHFFDYMGIKSSQTTVAANWSSFLASTGVPGAINLQATNVIPNPPPANSLTTGAWPVGNPSLGAGENLYLTNIGCNHLTGTNIVLMVDVLYACGGIATSLVTSQGISTSALPRWTGGAGLQMTLEVVVAPGTATGIPTVRISYVDQSGAAGDTGTITLGLTSPAVYRLLPLQDGPMIRLATDDWGIQSVSAMIFNTSMAGAGGRMALHLYKPIILLPTLATTTFVERSTPAAIGGIRALTSVAQGSLPCLGFFVLTSTTSTGIQTYLTEFVWG